MNPVGLPPVVGVDLGGTEIAVASVGPDANVGPIMTASTPADEGPSAVLDAAAGLIHQVLPDPASGVSPRVGIGTAGLVDWRDGTIISSTEALRDWAGTPVAAGIRDRLAALEHPDAVITVDNDVTAHAVGEAVYGSGTGRECLLLVTVGTGVGAAFVQGETPRRGAHFGAGEIGHLPTPGAEGRRCPCGRRGHLEAAASGPALAGRYRERHGGSVDARTVLHRSAAGEPEAIRVVTEAGTALGRALAGQVTLLDPDLLLLGGGIAEGGPTWWDAVESTLRAELIDVLQGVPLRRPSLGSSAAILGAAHVARTVDPARTRHGAATQREGAHGEVGRKHA